MKALLLSPKRLSDLSEKKLCCLSKDKLSIGAKSLKYKERVKQTKIQSYKQENILKLKKITFRKKDGQEKSLSGVYIVHLIISNLLMRLMFFPSLEVARKAVSLFFMQFPPFSSPQSLFFTNFPQQQFKLTNTSAMNIFNTESFFSQIRSITFSLNDIRKTMSLPIASVKFAQSQKG